MKPDYTSLGEGLARQNINHTIVLCTYVCMYLGGACTVEYKPRDCPMYVLRTRDVHPFAELVINEDFKKQ